MPISVSAIIQTIHPRLIIVCMPRHGDEFLRKRIADWPTYFHRVVVSRVRVLVVLLVLCNKFLGVAYRVSEDEYTGLYFEFPALCKILNRTKIKNTEQVATEPHQRFNHCRFRSSISNYLCVQKLVQLYPLMAAFWNFSQFAYIKILILTKIAKFSIYIQMSKNITLIIAESDSA